MNEINDLLHTSLSAQFDYILSRYNSKKDINNFDNASQFILSCVHELPNFEQVIFDSFCIDFDDVGFNNKPAQDCFELYNETKNLMVARFITGRSTETVLEKL